VWSSSSLLQTCHSLYKKGYLKDFEVGDKIARGFADLGFEEFLLISEASLVSILSGNTSALTNKEHFFLIPSFLQACNLLAELQLEPICFEKLLGARWGVKALVHDAHLLASVEAVAFDTNNKSALEFIGSKTCAHDPIESMLKVALHLIEQQTHE
jgi:hypothetical protein